MKEREKKRRSLRSLMGWEFRKQYGKTLSLILLIILLAGNGFRAWQVYDEYYSRREYLHEEYIQVYQEFYDTYSGPLQADKISEFMAIYTPIREKAVSGLYFGYDPNSYTYSVQMDFSMLDSMEVEMEYGWFYESFAAQAVEDARANQSLYQAKGNLYEAGKNAAIASLFAGRSIDVYVNTAMYQRYVLYDFSLLPVLLLCLYGMSNVFTMEKDSEMNHLLASARNGGRRTAVAKLLSSLLSALAVCLLFWAEDLIVFTVSFGIEGCFSQPLYALTIFQNTPLSCTFAGFTLVLALIRYLGVAGFCLIFLMISRLTGQVIVSYAAGLASCAGLILLQAFPTVKGITAFLNPAELLFARELFYRTEFVNLFGYAVPRYMMVIGGVLALEAAMAAALVGTGGRRAGGKSRFLTGRLWMGRKFRPLDGQAGSGRRSRLLTGRTGGGRKSRLPAEGGQDDAWI